MKSLPIFKFNDTGLTLLQTRWKEALDPVLQNPALDSVILKDVSLIAGSNVINTLLGRKLQGWKIVRQRAAASVYDNQDSNPRPELTLILVSSAPVVVDLEVF